MAFGKKKNKYLKLFIKIFLIAACIGASILSVYFIYNSKVNLYKKEIELMNVNLKRKVLISKKRAIAGTIIDSGGFYESEISSNLPQDQFATIADYKKILSVDIEQDLPIMKSMIYEEKINKDIREEELNMFLLPSNLKKNHYIDVRINFPNGEDYIVLSKKKVREIELPENTLWLWIDEKEILTLSSAIVDAYLHKGSKLYTVRYVAPAAQEEAFLTYPVNQDVLKIIKENPNILEEAKKNLSNEVRRGLEERLTKVTDEAIIKIDKGITEEVVNRESKILKDKERVNSEELIEDTQDVNGEEKDDESFY